MRGFAQRSIRVFIGALIIAGGALALPQTGFAQGVSLDTAFKLAVDGAEKLGAGTKYQSLRNWNEFDRTGLCFMVGRLDQVALNVAVSITSALNDSNSKQVGYSLKPIQNVSMSIVRDLVLLQSYCSVGFAEDFQVIMNFKIDSDAAPKSLEHAKKMFESLNSRADVMGTELKKFYEEVKKRKNEERIIRVTT